MSAIRRIKIYGERNTGTNLVERALRELSDAYVYPGNLPPSRQRLHALLELAAPFERTREFIEAERDRAFTRNFNYSLGWKHAGTRPDAAGWVYPQDVGFVTLRKNPYSWLLSLHRRPYSVPNRKGRAASAFGDFLRMPWPTRVRENAPPVYETPVHLWCDKVSSYEALDTYRPTVHVRYEDLLSEPEGVFRCIGRSLGVQIAFSSDALQAATKRHPKDFDFYRRYYLEERWREKLDGDAVAFINSILDRQLVERSGYAMIDPREVHPPVAKI